MKYKLSDKLNAFLTDNVLPQFKDAIEKKILTSFNESDILLAKTFQVDANKTVYGIEFCIDLMRKDLVEIEQLKPYVWYPREKFDGNPNDYFLVETGIAEEMYYVSYGMEHNLHLLKGDATHFMYIEQPNK